MEKLEKIEWSVSRCVLALRRDFSRFCAGVLGELGLAPGLMFFVIYLGRHPDTSPGQLAAALGADTGHTARSVEKLVRGGFVDRRKDPADGRAFLLRLTPRGEDAFREIRSLFSRWDRESLSALTPEEGRELERLLEKLVRGKDLSLRDGRGRPASSKEELLS